MNFIQAVFKQKRVIYFLLFSLCLAGIISFHLLSKLEDPELKIKSALVVVPYPGASAECVEESVTKILENHLRTIPNIKDIESRSLANYSEIHLSLETTVPEDEVDQYWDFLRKKVADVERFLPPGAYMPQVYDDFGDVYGLFYAMSSDGIDYDQMREYAHTVRDRLLAVNGVKRVLLNGVQNSEIDIKIDADKLSHLGIMPSTIVSTIEDQLKDLYAGAYLTQNKNIRVSVPRSLVQMQQLKNVIIRGGKDVQYRLSEIATIERKIEEPFSSRMYYNHEPAIGISISMNPGENVVAIGECVEKEMTIIQKQMPLGISFHKVYFQSDLVKESLNSFVLNLVISVMIVVGILLIVLGWRSSVVIGASLILSIVGSLPFLLLWGGTIQRVSLGAFIVAMGMLVDNAIVVIDGIYEDLKVGKSWRTAFQVSPQKRAMPLLGATLITILSFLPVYLSPDATGVYTRDLFLVLATSLFLSWFLSMTQVPLFASMVLTKGIVCSRKKKDRLKETFQRIISWALMHPKRVIFTSVLLLVGSLWATKFMKSEFFPNMNYRQNYLTYKLPNGVHPKVLEKDLQEITSWLLTQQGVEEVTSNIGGAATRYTLVRIIPDMNDSYGEIIISYSSWEDVESLRSKILDHVHTYYPDAFSELKSYALISVEALVECNFYGPEIDTLKMLSKHAESIFQSSSYVDRYSVHNNWEPVTPYLHVNYRQLDGASMVVSRQDASLALLMSTSGVPIHRYFEKETEIPLKLKMTDNGGEDIDVLRHIPVWGKGAIHLPIQEVLQGDISLEEVEEKLLAPSPLSAVADLSIAWEEPLIRRENGVRTIKVMCNPKETHTATEVMTDVRKEIENISLPKGYHLKWGGEAGDQANATKYIVLFIPLALFGIVLILLLLYKSYRKMWITLFCVLLAWIGVIPAMIVTGKAFGFLAMVGVVGLAGMMIKNAVVLIEDIDVRMQSYENKNAALLDAALSRVRPVMMGAMTTILGMIPLVRDVFFGSLAVTIMGGLFIGTLITLIVIPVLFSISFK
ncbi:efflux RND transporter permease subunit [Halosquirtibacter laminarini]|uniref:Efflux RND transporter permease subunit n=1 Tax=Halosquirtibacter laminarini TaxID=3374600 RepID=A0AC61NGS9_9BACT|nr:efflux RND transporter permease subunit [Prolixibacteraceae bacterium]